MGKQIYFLTSFSLALRGFGRMAGQFCGYARVCAVCAAALCNVTPVSAERIGSTVFYQLPQDYQLYPRDERSVAEIPVTGYTELPGYSYVSVVVTRDGARYGYSRAAIHYTAAEKGEFSLRPSIKSELAAYGVSVYLCKGQDSVQVVSRSNIVAGDTYVIMGQSNSTGFFMETETNPFCRTFGIVTEILNTADYNPADTLWSLSNLDYSTNVGTMGFALQKSLAERTGIPNCVINGGIHWSTAEIHAIRNPDNPASMTNAYGRMLYRVQKAGMSKAVKAFIYRQGESEAYHEGAAWDGFFDKFYGNLKTDLPDIGKLYVFQIDIIFYPSDRGTKIRDYQRRLPSLYDNIEVIATVGTQGFDGLHYSKDGNRQGGQELSRLIERDFYGGAPDVNLSSPSIRKVLSSEVATDQLLLVFEEGQRMVYPGPYAPNGNITLHMKDFFYLNGFQGGVVSGKADGNRIVLQLTGPLHAERLRYLPDFVEEGGSFYPYTGPYLTNVNGMRALTFYDVQIDKALKDPVLAAEVGGQEVLLSWAPVNGAEVYVLEKKGPDQEDFQVLQRLDATKTGYTDPGVPAPGLTTSYRIKAVSDRNESFGFGTASVTGPMLVLGEPVSAVFMKCYPNPVISGQLHVSFHTPVTGSLEIIRPDGRKIRRLPLNSTSRLTLDTPREAGIYLIRVEAEGEVYVSKVVSE